MIDFNSQNYDRFVITLKSIFYWEIRNYLNIFHFSKFFGRKFLFFELILFKIFIICMKLILILIQLFKFVLFTV